MTLRPIFAWYDLWVGAYIDKDRCRVYLMVPMVGIVLHFHKWVTDAYMHDDGRWRWKHCSTCGRQKERPAEPASQEVPRG